jgi:hypothetical protein
VAWALLPGAIAVARRAPADPETDAVRRPKDAYSFHLLLAVGRCPRPRSRSAGPRLQVLENSWVSLLVAVDASWVEPPLLTRLPLPLGPQAIDIGVQKKDERILKGPVSVADAASFAEIDVGGVMGVLDRLSDCLPLLRLRQTVTGRQDCGVRVHHRRPRVQVTTDLPRWIGRIPCIISAAWKAATVVETVQRRSGPAAGAAHESVRSGGEQVHRMKPLTRLADLLERAAKKGVFGTKMRSVIKEANPGGIDQVLDQQFEVAKQIQDVGFLPIVEPEVDIKSRTRAEADELLVKGLCQRLNDLPSGVHVVLKLSLPARAGHYSELIQHPAVVRVLALSGGFSRAEAVHALSQNPGVIASFSRALLEGLSVDQSVAEFNAALTHAVEAIYVVSAA